MTPKPYEVPFSAAVNGASVKLTGGTVGLDLEGVTASICGLIGLPGQSGTVIANPPGASGPGGTDPNFNNNVQFVGQPYRLNVTVAGMPLPIQQAYVAADGELTTQIAPTAAANGGLNIEFSLDAKFTSALNISAFLPFLPAPVAALLGPFLQQVGSTSACTLVGGDLAEAGVPSADIPNLLPPGVVGRPIKLTTGTSGAVTGKPVTGPITAGTGLLVANDFPTAAIDPNTPPAISSPPSALGCGAVLPIPGSPTVAGLLNGLLGLPAPVGATTFSSPGMFAVHVTS